MANGDLRRTPSRTRHSATSHPRRAELQDVAARRRHRQGLGRSDDLTAGALAARRNARRRSAPPRALQSGGEAFRGVLEMNAPTEESRIVGVVPWLPWPLSAWPWWTAPVRAERLAALRIALAGFLLLDILFTYLPDLFTYFAAGSLGDPSLFAWHTD